MKKIFLLLICFASIYSNVAFSQMDKHGQLVLAFDPKSDSIYGKDTYKISLYFIENKHNCYLIYEDINYLGNFEYVCRYGSITDEYFVFKSTSSAVGGAKLIYWQPGTCEIFSSGLLGEVLVPNETSFSAESLYINCISVDDQECGTIYLKPVLLLRKVSSEDLVGNNLPLFLKVIRKWEY